MSRFEISGEQLGQFEQNGYVLVNGLFDADEIGLLGQIARADEELRENRAERRDAQGGITTLSVSNDLGDDIYGAICRSERIVNTMERLLGGEVYHYHHKMNMKEPFVGGAWEWHQDYGYWYNNGCLFPYMASCLIAVDSATRENGCLQVIKGSQLMGRIDHGKTGDQTGADRERVNATLERMELVHVEMNPGDALFFHGNLLHRSDQNRSPNPRWVFICCYNAARNDPYKESKHPKYSRLEKWPDERIMEIAALQDTGNS